ncbi:uncharacterized protein LOC124439177 [Xenia sp. Carnegie-2017]|uniref:uncharacterized protein LOC124439177 n=1 Tax=Xenia sp. Carnegie-2017 TaxID=2897299 RepID=UPI001F04A5B7|nr:uncharacterized protein LOC124439177 [Xenia sp. Carnegie-2017]
MKVTLPSSSSSSSSSSPGVPGANEPLSHIARAEDITMKEIEYFPKIIEFPGEDDLVPSLPPDDDFFTEKSDPKQFEDEWPIADDSVMMVDKETGKLRKEDAGDGKRKSDVLPQPF